MADANVVSLQNAVNRFAHVAGFSPIAVDGVAGNETLLGARKALDWIAVETNDRIPSTISDQAATFEARTASTVPVLAINAGPLSGFLNYVANLAQLPMISGPAPLVSQAANAGAKIQQVITNPSAGAASLVNAFKALPTWQKLGLGLLAGFGLMFAHKKLTQRKQLSGYPSHCA